jgi:hypothetical protein
VKKDYPKKNLSTDSYHTDAWILDLFEGWFDPCPFNPGYKNGKDLDGLTISWGEKTFCNPPYSNPLPWVKKAIRESREGKTVVMLLKHDSSTKWYQCLHEAGARMMMIQGRLKHQTSKPAAFPSLLVVLSKTNIIIGNFDRNQLRLGDLYS